MPAKLRLGAVLALLVSIAFCVFFENSKHAPLFSRVNPFAEDPYDAIGSFAIQAAAVLAVVALLRAFWPYTMGSVSEKQKALLVRTEMLAFVAVGVTLAGDAIAMARHTSLWMHSRGGHILFELLLGMGVLTTAAGVFVHRDASHVPLPKTTNPSRTAAVVSVAAILILAFYPERLRSTLAGELFTVLVGDILLFVPLALLGMALVPGQGDTDFYDPVRSAWAKLREHQWKLTLLVGMLTGALLALAELHEANGWPHLTSHIVFVLAVFVGLETAGLLLGYAILRVPLGLS